MTPPPDLPPAEDAEFDAWLDSRLAALPLMSPAEGFAERVMARVAVPDPFAIRSLRAMPRRLLATRRTLAAAATLAVIVLGSMAGSVVWSLGHQQTLAAFGGWLASEASALAWVGLRGVASNLVEQPWYTAARGLVGSPAHLAGASALASLTYAAGVVALRRLLALPARQVSHAGA
jgi:hypothetical protein